MADFDEWGQRAKDVASDIGKRAQDSLDVQRIKGQIRSLNRSNERDFQEIGKIIYDKYKNGETVEEDVTGLCDGIQGREEEIENHQAQIDQIKGSEE